MRLARCLSQALLLFTLDLRAESRSADISNHLVNLRRAKMHRLKQELEKIGAHVTTSDLADPDNFSGIRRLRILHQKAVNASEPIPASPTAALPTNPPDLHERSPVHADPKPEPLVMVSSDGFISGLNKWESIAVVVCGGILLIVILYVVYKYIQWRPKQIARKGYRAVAKSKGLQQEDSGGLSSDGIIRAGTRPDAVSSK